MLHEAVGMMWLLYVLLGTLAHAQYDNGDDSLLDQDLYHTDEITSTPTMLTEDQLVTLRRLISRSTLYREQLADVKDALKVLMQNRVMDDMFLSTVGYYRDTDAARTDPDTSWHPVANNILLDILNKLDTNDQSNSQDMQSRTSPLLRRQVDAIPRPTLSPAPVSGKWSTMELSLGIDDYTDDYDSTYSIVPTRTSSVKSSIENNKMPVTTVVDVGMLVATRSKSVNARRTYEDFNQKINNSDYLDSYDRKGWVELTTLKARKNMDDDTIPKDTDYKQIARQGNTSTGGDGITTILTQPQPPSTKRSTRHTRMRKTWRYTYSTTRTKSRRKKTRYRTTTTTTTTTTTPMILNIPRLIEVITNLTLDYSNNLTLKMNKTLQDMKIFTCPTAVTLLVTRKEVGNDTTTTTTTIETTTIESTTVTPDPYTNLTGTIMGKCFVCGLEDPGMPRDARCADAFSGDFIPLVPVEATARKKLAEYRKYCRWMNVPRYVINQSDPRSVWGRWTGGCSVRWVDVSGIYTQRSCRNRHRAVMGMHWASKRMAKLEMALQRMDQGCIISPMSSLIPLSRGVSLYARFHACVCTGSWCNHAALNMQCTARVVGTLLILLLGTVT